VHAHQVLHGVVNDRTIRPRMPEVVCRPLRSLPSIHPSGALRERTYFSPHPPEKTEPLCGENAPSEAALPHSVSGQDVRSCARPGGRNAHNESAAFDFAQAKECELCGELQSACTKAGCSCVIRRTCVPKGLSITISDSQVPNLPYKRRLHAMLAVRRFFAPSMAHAPHHRHPAGFARCAYACAWMARGRRVHGRTTAPTRVA